MDSFNGYKLKPESHRIKTGDIIIRVKSGTTTAPTGTLGIALRGDRVSFPTQSEWGTDYIDWRAIETIPGSEAKAGDTVYCIMNTGGYCCKHDIVKVHRFDRKSNRIYPGGNQKLRNNHITCSFWNWMANCFVVLATVDSVSEFPCFRQANILKHIVKFTSPIKGRVVNAGESTYKVNYLSTDWIDYNRTDTWTPCEDPSNQKEIDTIQELIESTLLDPITTVYVDSMMNKPTQTKPNTKGKQMNSSLFTDILKLLTQVEQTDLEKAPSTYAFFYNEDGEYEGTARVANEAEAKALLQKPEHLGYTMRIYSFSDEFTTQIPVVSTIKKTVATKPTIKPRKPRATKECKQ